MSSCSKVLVTFWAVHHFTIISVNIVNTIFFILNVAQRFCVWVVADLILLDCQVSRYLLKCKNGSSMHSNRYYLYILLCVVALRHLLKKNDHCTQWSFFTNGNTFMRILAYSEGAFHIISIVRAIVFGLVILPFPIVSNIFPNSGACISLFWALK